MPSLSQPAKSFKITAATACTLLAGVAGFAKAEITPSYLPPASEVLHLDKLQVTGGLDEATYAIQRSVTATKTDTALVDVPQAISVITRELIDDQAMRSIGDVTRYVPGVGIAQGEGNRDTPVMRGNSTTADFFVDGVRDDVQYFRDLYNVDRVEVLKGPNAMIFGRGGSGGLINRVSKQALGRDHRELTLQAGSDEQFRATLDYGAAASGTFAYRLTGVYEDSESYRDGVTLQRHGLNPTFAWAIAPATSLRFGYEYFHDERVADRGVSSYQGRPVRADAATFFGDPAQSPVEATVNSAFALLEHRFGHGVSLRSHTRYSVYDKFYQNVFPGAVNAAGTSVALSAYNQGTDRENLFNQTDLEFFAETGAVKHHFLTGLEVARQETDNVRLTGYFATITPTTTSVSVPLTNPRTTLPVTFRPSATDANNHGVAETFAVYAQDQVTLLPQLQAIAGLRYERFTVDFLNNRTGAALDSTDEMLSPRAGLLYKPAANVSLYASYTMSFVPRAGEQLASLTATNRAFDPEEFNNQEIGVKWDLRPDLFLTAALYRLDRTNVVITDPADPTKSLLVDGQRAEGAELGLTGRVTRNWSLAGGYAYQDGRILSTQSATVVAGRRLAQLPRHTLSLWNRYDFNRTWGVGLGAIYRDEIFASTDNTVTLPSFVRLDAAVFCRLSENLRAQLNVENILDRAYYASAHSNNNITPGSPRAFRVSLTTTF
ncbi:putative TonB-dependent receptor BfrD precursor [Lacunisphaera limnophila]|uniref:Putative TonB-dependent receptor BfrD n=1 Tax=Lacunisphaera limnophila TaxID=1838286 RepID=A0A1D8AUZ3_9BACT|nr:TonB-dependent siderophore receptor [Lacunisphaera limnophila]AOS44666.1 putative TonB-dependent receptor BfrD precursor [Lacunisphaera limnophila]